MAKLVSRFVWIWPTWDSDRSSTAHRYESETVELGWFWVDKDTQTIEFCQCERVINRAGTLLRRCSYSNETTEDETMMSPELCHVRTSYVAKYVRADHALDMMTSNPCWMTDDDADDGGGVIIDVDEDFFGCESPSDMLAGAAWACLLLQTHI